MSSRADGGWGTVIIVALAMITVLIAASGRGAGSPARHAYVIPVIVAALRFGPTGGVVVSVGAAFLYAPFVLPEIEWLGFTERGADGLASLTTFLLVGLLTGAVAQRSRRARGHYETALAVQRALAEARPLESILHQLRRTLRDGLRMTDVGLLVLEGDRALSCGPLSGADLPPECATARFVPDAGGHPRPLRQLVVPLIARGETVGALSVERIGEIAAAEQAGIVTLAAHVGLALENARLASRQRRFAGELAEKIADATRRSDEMDRARSAFVATVSHELRTPLTALLGFGELLATRPFSSDEVHRLAGIVHRETERLVRIVDDLLDLSRVERGLPPTLHRTAVEVAPAVLSAVEMFRRQQVAHHFEIDCADGVGAIEADPDAVDRILKNLISNALKYSPPGLVTLRVRGVGHLIEFQIEDGGRGIPADALPRLFEPYYRAPHDAGAARGTGLGLAIVKSLVEAHGGSVSVASIVDTGTRVSFTLPRARVSPATALQRAR